MKKVLLSMLLAMSSIGVWAQASHTTYKFNASSDGTLFLDDQGSIVASYDANDVCNQTYYLKVDYKHTTAPATKDGPATFDVTDYYVDGVCAYGQTYDAGKAYETITFNEKITDGNKGNYIGEIATFTKNDAIEKTEYKKNEHDDNYSWQGTGVCVNIGDECIDDTYYKIKANGAVIKGTELKGSGWSWLSVVSVSNGFIKDGIYTLSDEIYVKVPSPVVDPSQTYYYVTFTPADPSVVAASANFKASKLVNLTGDSRTLYHKSGTSYDNVNDGDEFFEDDEYYVEGISYQPYKPEQLAALNYVTPEITYYNCDVVESLDKTKLTITYKYYGYSNSFAEYIKDCIDVVNGHATVEVVNSDGNQYGGTDNAVAKVFEAINGSEGVLNLVLAKFANSGNVKVDVRNWNSSVKRVISPDIKSYDTFFAKVTTDANSPIVQQYKEDDHKESILVSHPGDLYAIKDAHYYSDDIDNAYWIEIRGNINADDISFINGIHNDRLNLSLARSSGDEDALRAAMHNFTNDYVKYLAWPVFTTEPSDPLYVDLYENCDNLVAVGQYVVPVNAGGSTIADATKLVAYTRGQGKIKEITDMLAIVTDNNTNIKNIKISGNLNALDLYKYDQVYDKVGLDGHLYFTEEVDEYATTAQSDRKNAADANNQSTSTGALNGCGAIVSIDLSDAVFEKYEDMTLRNLNLIGASTKVVKIPTSPLVTELPADFLNAATQIEEICIPANIEKIHARAFYALNLKHVWTTGTNPEVKYDNGATYEVAGENETRSLKPYNYGEEIPAGANMVYGTYTFSPNLKFIGSGAFASSINIHDVYMLGRTAPVCNVDAFSTVSYVANNSYQADAVPEKIDRDAYANTTYAWMTMLHFPAECTDDEASLYTDITRRYSIASDKRDGNGNIVYYPTQCEWNRSFVQGTTGYLWNAFCNKRNPYSGTAMAFYITNAWHQQALADGTPNNHTQNTILYGTGTAQSTYQATANGMYNTNDEEESVKSREVFYDTSSDGSTALAYNTTLYNADYRGWHQFVLAEYGYSDKIVISFEDFYDSNWWTICEPFPLTSAELKKAFGDNVKLCKLVSVTRNVEKGGIRLNFGPNLVGTDEANGYTLQAGVPYMIKPALPTDGTTLDQKLAYEVSNTTDNIERFAEKSAEALENLLKNGMYTVDAILINNTGDCKEPEVAGANGTKIHESLKYTMMGTFFKYYLPQYCYFLGWDDDYNGPAFFWHDGVADMGDRNWNPYTAVIVPNWIGADNPFEHPETGQFDTIHYRYSSEGAIGESDDFAVASNETKRMYLNFAADEDEEATEIQTIHVGNTTYYNGNVYNMNGQLISNGCNLNTLPKGIYIVNGKKYISK